MTSVRISVKPGIPQAISRVTSVTSVTSDIPQAISCAAADANNTISIGWWVLGACDIPEAPVQGCDLGLLQIVPVLLGSTAGLLLGHIILFILVPVLAATLERPHFARQRETSVFLKLSFFQVFNV